MSKLFRLVSSNGKSFYFRLFSDKVVQHPVPSGCARNLKGDNSGSVAEPLCVCAGAEPLF